MDCYPYFSKEEHSMISEITLNQMIMLTKKAIKAKEAL